MRGRPWSDAWDVFDVRDPMGRPCPPPVLKDSAARDHHWKGRCHIFTIRCLLNCRCDALVLLFVGVVETVIRCPLL